MSSSRMFPLPAAYDPPFDDPPQLLDLLPIDRIGADADLEAVEVGRIMASGDHHAAVHPEVADGEIEHRGGAQADIGHIDPRGHDPPADGILIGFRTEAAIPAQGHCPNAMTHGIGADRPAEKIDEVRGRDPCLRLPGHHTPGIHRDSLRHLMTGKVASKIDMGPDHLCRSWRSSRCRLWSEAIPSPRSAGRSRRYPRKRGGAGSPVWRLSR